MKEKKKYVLMAQTTPDASFEPIFIVTAHASLIRAFKT